MGFFDKVKGILFEEVEDEKETSKEEAHSSIARKVEPDVRPTANIDRDTSFNRVESPKKEEPININPDHLSERELFKSENTFPFPEFDEVEFHEQVEAVKKPKATTNVLEYEKKKRVEKKYDLGRYEKIERVETVEKKKFKPSPIISPVYGILNEDYKPEDIEDKTLENKEKAIDFASVRKKAFGSVDTLENLEQTNKEPETFVEESVTVKLKEPDEEKIQKVKTIDELLEDTADVKIDVPEEKEEEIKSYDDVDEELEEVGKTNKTIEESVEDDDTLESDLFDLIDSMYDNREEGEE